MTVYFYVPSEEPYGAFSNFSRHWFELDALSWPSSEHYYQAQKYVGTEHMDLVRRAKSAKDAARMGRDRLRPLRPDWESVKDDVMRRAVRRKFETHASLRDLLLGTEQQEIVENAPGDYYWGAGADGSGKNMLGIILMETRESLRG